jgi:hypothetical protein
MNELGQNAAVGIIGLYRLAREDIYKKKKRRLGFAEGEPFLSFYLSDNSRIIRTTWTTFFKKICFLIKGQQKIGPMI